MTHDNLIQAKKAFDECYPSDDPLLPAINLLRVMSKHLIAQSAEIYSLPCSKSISESSEITVPDNFIPIKEYADLTLIASHGWISGLLYAGFNPECTIKVRNKWYVNPIEFSKYLSTLSKECPNISKKAAQYLKNISA